MNTRITARLTLALTTALLVAGCSRSSTGPDPPDPDIPEYKPRTSPPNVIWNVARAYENMDAEAYLDCLAEDYIFFINPDDQSEHPHLPEYWDKNEEREIHENMFGEETDVEAVSLVFTHHDQIWDDNGTGDPMDDLWSFVEAVDLRVTVPPDLTLHADAPAEFLFHIDPDSTGPNGEILWEIWKQWDLNARGPGERPHDREDSSWGRIKSIYR